MSVREFINGAVLKNKAMDIASRAREYLNDMPALWEKLEQFFNGAELLQMLKMDNDCADFLAGRINLSEDTLQYLLEWALRDIEDLEYASLAVKEGYILCGVLVKKKPGLHVLLKIGEVKVTLGQDSQKVSVTMMEFPEVTSKNLLVNMMLKVISLLARKVIGPERVYRCAVKKVPALSSDQHSLTLDLAEIPAVEEFISREILGVKLACFYGIDRVELRKGEIRIYGGPKIPGLFSR